MSKRIIVINGKGGIGKDTLIGAIESMNEPYIEVYNESSIDPIRGMVARGFDGIRLLSKAAKVKDNAYRTLLSTMKKAVDDFYMVNYGVKYTNDYLKACTIGYINGIGNYQDTSEDSVLFIHIREPENITAYLNSIKDMLKGSDIEAVTLLVTSCRAQEDYGNDSDNNVENYPYDFVYKSDEDINSERKKFRAFFLSKIMKKENM